MTKELIERINFLASKSKNEGLTEEEKKEQEILRNQYIAEFRQGVKNVLSNVRVVDDNGNKKKLKRK